MAEQFDPEQTYALHYEGTRLGIVRKGLYYEGPEACLLYTSPSPRDS